MPTPFPARAVVFDMDDTLYLERDFVRSGYHAVAEHLRRTRHRSEGFEDWLWQRFLAGQARNAFNALDEEYQLDLDPPALAELIDVYRFHTPDISPCEGIAELLESFARNAHLGLISDGPARMQRNKLHALGLDGRFDAVVLTDDLGPDAGKPSEKPFLEIQRRLHVPPEACCYVADNPAKDFLAPNTLGWRSIRYLRDGQIYAEAPAPPGGRPQHTVRTDGELLHCFD